MYFRFANLVENRLLKYVLVILWIPVVMYPLIWVFSLDLLFYFDEIFINITSFSKNLSNPYGMQPESEHSPYK